MFQDIGQILILFWRTLRALPLTWRHRQKVFDQLFEIGNASLFVACILSLSIGGVLALQTGPVVAERGFSGLIGEDAADGQREDARHEQAGVADLE